MKRIFQKNTFAYLVYISIISSFIIFISVPHIKHVILNYQYNSNSSSYLETKEQQMSSMSLNKLLQLYLENAKKVLNEIDVRVKRCNDEMNMETVLKTLIVEKRIYNWKKIIEYEVCRDYYGIGDEYCLVINRIGDDGKIISINIIKYSIGGSTNIIYKGIPKRNEPIDINSQYFIVTIKEAAIASLRLTLTHNAKVIVQKEFYLSYIVNNEDQVDKNYDSKTLLGGTCFSTSNGESEDRFYELRFLGPGEKGIHFEFSYSYSRNKQNEIDIPTTEISLSYMLNRNIQFGSEVSISIEWFK